MDRWRVASVLEEIAGSLLVREDPRMAVAVLGYADSLARKPRNTDSPGRSPDRDAALARLQRRLGSRAMHAGRSDGRSWVLDRALEVASQSIEHLAGGAAKPRRPSATPILTTRELAVLKLLADGHTNREIAGELYISPSTAGACVEHHAQARRQAPR